MSSPSQKRVLLIISGGVSAYKSLLLIRLLKKQNINVTAIMTKSAQEFITPLQVSSLTGEKTYTELFSLTDEIDIGHIELSRSADLVVIAPATANILAKMASGIADDLASTLLLATNTQILAAPAMNVQMWHNSATQRNLAQLKKDGIDFVEPEEGSMACGEFGIGRLAEPENIADAILSHFNAGSDKIKKPLQGKKILITAGPTHEPIDPVRVIANLSSGKQGYAIAEKAAIAGAEVTLISGPVALPCPEGVKRIMVQSANDMLKATKENLPSDIGIFTAAVADWRVETISDQKIKKTQDQNTHSLSLIKNPDILATISNDKSLRPKFLVGFAAETENVIENAKIKLHNKNLDLIIANDVSHETGIMGGDKNKVHLISAGEITSWDEMDKKAVALSLINYLASIDLS